MIRKKMSDKATFSLLGFAYGLMTMVIITVVMIVQLEMNHEKIMKEKYGVTLYPAMPAGQY